MHVSIIVPTLHEEAHIVLTIRSLQRLSGEREIIVVDGGSTDQTVPLACAQNLRVLEAPQGRGLQMHVGALESTGDVLWFLHADTIPPAHALEHIRKSLETKSTVGGNFGLLFDGPSRAARQLTAIYPLLRIFGSLLDFSEAAGYYGLFAFLALFILPALAVPPQFVPRFYFIGNAGALVGGMVAAFLLDKIGRKITVPSFYALAAMGVLLLAAATRTGDWRWVLAAFTLANLFATGSWISAYPTFSEIFPTHLRSTGIGLSVAVGRIGAFIAPLALTLVANAAGMLPALALLAAFWLIGVIAMVPWYFRGVEGKGMPLEAMVG